MKKILALLMSVMLCFCFAACESTTPQNKSEVSSVITESETSSFASSDSATTSSEPSSSKQNSTSSKNNSTSSKNTSTSSTAPASSDDTNSKTSTSSRVASVSIPNNLRPVVSSRPSDNVSSTVLGGTQEDSQNSTITPLLYSVKGQNGATIYLFGSINVGSINTYPFPTYVVSALMNADSVAVGCDIVDVTDEEMSAAIDHVIYTDGRNISNDLNDNVYSSAKSILKRHKVYDSTLDYYKPVIWADLIESIITANASYSAELGINIAVIDMALYDNKEIIEIESIERQYEVLGSLSQPLQDYLLRDAVKKYNDYNPFKETEDLIEVWCKGDYESLRKLSGVNADGQSPTTKALLQEYHTKMQTNRNKLMTDFVVEKLKGNKDVFVSVDVAHVVGEGGIIDQLKNLGYTVTQVTK